MHQKAKFGFSVPSLASVNATNGVMNAEMYQWLGLSPQWRGGGG